MRRKKKVPEKKALFVKVIAIAMLLCVVVLVTLLGIFWNRKRMLAAETKEQKTERVKQENIDQVKSTLYYSEVDYTGETFLDKGLFEIPFRKSGCNYVSNKEFVKDRPEETLEEIQETSKAYINALLNTGYQKVKKDQQGFLDKIENMSSPQCFYWEENNSISAEKFAEEAMSWYIDNEIQIESEFITDRCLIYLNDTVYNRGEWHFTVYHGKDLSLLEKKTGIENIKMGKEYIVFLELRYIPHEYDKIVEIEKIGSSEKG